MWLRIVAIGVMVSLHSGFENRNRAVGRMLAVFLLRWFRLSDGMSGASGDELALGDLRTDLGLGPAQGHAGPARLDRGAANLASDPHGVAGANELGAVALPPFGVSGGRVAPALVLGQPLLVSEGFAFRRPVLPNIGFLL